MKKKHDPVEAFIALPDTEKKRIVAELEAETPQARMARSRPLNARERKEFESFRAEMVEQRRGRGRPKFGKDGVTRVSISVEASLLQQIDEYAEAHDLNRSELFARGAKALIT